MTPEGDDKRNEMIWEYSNRADPRARKLADRHYNRQKIGAPQFVPPGRCCVLYAKTETGEAFWVTSWPFPEWVKHAWKGAWVCSAFRNEGAGKASVLIRQALSATRYLLGDPPSLGMITFINRSKVKPIKFHGNPVWGWTYIKSGFKEVGQTKGGLLAFQIDPDDMPPPNPPNPRRIAQ